MENNELIPPCTSAKEPAFTEQRNLSSGVGMRKRDKKDGIRRAAASGTEKTLYWFTALL